MDKQVEARAAELREMLIRANRLYHEQDAPEISDAEYDCLFRELTELEAAHPELVRPESPTQRVGAPSGGSLGDVEHRVPMLSLSNAFDSDELRAFDARVRKGLALAEEDEQCERNTDPPDGGLPCFSYLFLIHAIFSWLI